MEGLRYQTGSTARPQMFTGSDKPLQPQQPEDSFGTEGEGRSRRKFQRTANDNDNLSFRKPIMPASAMRQTSDNKTNVARRRSTLRENKPLLGPRPLEHAAGKRIVSDGTIPRPPVELRNNYLPNSSSMPVLDKKSKDTRFSFGLQPSPTTDKSPNGSGSLDFLPAVNFDDFQSSIASYEGNSMPKLTQFPVLDNSSAGQSEDSQDDTTSRRVLQQRTPRKTVPGQSQMQSISRHGSGARRDSTIPVKETPSIIPTTAPLAIRNRRQSAVPMTPQYTPVTGKPTRKSLAPGALANMSSHNSDKAEGMPPPSFTARSNIARTPSIPKTTRKPVGGQDPNMGIEQPRAMMSTRSSRAKAAQPSNPANNNYHLAEPQTIAGSSMPKSPGRTPNTNNNKAHLQRPTTPSSSGNKRQSGRMSGLGARTVSPTDAHRLKRMSMMQPPLPNTKPPPSPQPEPMPDIRATAKSPSLIPRRTNMTPSSSRDTPESTSRQYLPQFSLSRSSSYQSLRSINSVGISRMNPSPSLSKLPTPKGRSVYSSAERRDDDEVVPPVPAIPKAYESPSDLMDTPFFSDPKLISKNQSTLFGSGDNVGSELSGSVPTSAVEMRKSSMDLSDSPRHRRNLTMGAETAPPMPVGKPPETPAARKKSLQPLRLPPLNLLPLSTPTTSRIASFPVPSAEVDNRETTPPPRRNLAKTPSTPMTASKATYHRRQDEEQKSAYNLRSSSSHHALRGAVDHSALDDFTYAVPSLTLPTDMKRQITPFSSGSLPKAGNTGFTPVDRHGGDEYTLAHPEVNLQTSRPMGPRPRTVSKSVKESAPATQTASSTDDPETPVSGNSLRRRFSLNWRRSSSKNANRQAAESSETLPADYPEMPPPRLPASATMSSLQDINRKAPVNQGRSSLDQRRPSQPNLATNYGMDQMTKPSMPQLASATAFRSLHSNPAQPANGTRSSSWSILGGNRSQAPQARPSIPNMKPTGPNGIQRLDKDDMIANEEMRRLAAKRRDVESAAKETDELKKIATPKDPLTPAQAILASAGVLNIYEKGEIIDYKDGVYFCGTKSAKKHVGDIAAAGTTNFGYDDERGDYNIVIGDHLSYRYEVVDILGKGSFGQVVRCIDHKLGGLCAVKIIRNKKRFHQQALVEVNILKKLKEWDPDEAHATLTISSSFYFRSHLCIITPCLSINLYELIRAHSFQGFSVQLIRRFARQMLACLKLLQEKRVIHCDLKPENILLCDPRRADIRVIDFGSSCKTDEKVYTYIQSRFYRSPEVILGSEYGLGIDMWSFGCILAELYTGYPIFPGENEQEQLACIMEIFGPPSREIIEKSTRRKLFFDSTLKPRVTVSSKGRRRRPSSKSLSMAIKCEDEAFLDFISQCLRWDPERRIKPDQAVTHPFITNDMVRRMSERPRIRTGTAPNGPVTTGGIPSPVKRVPTTTAPVSMSSTFGTSQTPAKETRARPLPETPATAMRNGIPTRPPQQPQQQQADMMPKSSPMKQGVPASRRQSGIMMGSSLPTQVPPPNMAMAGSKRASNGLLLQQQGYGMPLPPSSSLPRVSSGKVGINVDLAGAAARESMGVSSGRLR